MLLFISNIGDCLNHFFTIIHDFLQLVLSCQHNFLSFPFLILTALAAIHFLMNDKCDNTHSSNISIPYYIIHYIYISIVCKDVQVEEIAIKCKLQVAFFIYLQPLFSMYHSLGRATAFFLQRNIFIPIPFLTPIWNMCVALIFCVYL